MKIRDCRTLDDVVALSRSAYVPKLKNSLFHGENLYRQFEEVSLLADNTKRIIVLHPNESIDGLALSCVRINHNGAVVEGKR